MRREDRVSHHKKQERVHVGDGIPSVHELVDAVPVLRRVSGGVTEYTRIGSVLFENVLEEVGKQKVASHDFSSDSSGYIKFENGLIIQWGYKSFSANSDTQDLPIPFPNNFFAVIGNGMDGSYATSHTVAKISLTGVTLYRNSTSSRTTSWIAIGN